MIHGGKEVWEERSWLQTSRTFQRAKQRAAEQLCPQKTTGMEGAPDFDLKKLKSVNQH